MAERPILFQGNMVLALLSGTKTQTRRDTNLHIVNKYPEAWQFTSIVGREAQFKHTNGFSAATCPYGQPGDRLWVRETAKLLPSSVTYGAERWVYAADPSEGDAFAVKFSGGFKPSIHMPRAASRLLLEITAVRVERVQDISEADAVAEGIERVSIGGNVPCKKWKNYQGRDYCDGMNLLHASESYRTLWQSINGPDSWATNPWVWVVEFKVVKEAPG